MPRYVHSHNVAFGMFYNPSQSPPQRPSSRPPTH